MIGEDDREDMGSVCIGVEPSLTVDEPGIDWEDVGTSCLFLNGYSDAVHGENWAFERNRWL